MRDYSSLRFFDPLLTSGPGPRGLNPDALCVVHATAYMPTQTADGYSIAPRSNTDSEVFRNTVHVSLNHRVSGHMLGNWDDMPYVVIAPFAATAQANGVPQSLSTVDTFWSLPPDKNLALPEAVLVRPGPVSGDALVEQKGREVFYVQDLTVGHLRRLAETSAVKGWLENENPTMVNQKHRQVILGIIASQTPNEIGLRQPLFEAGMARDERAAVQKLVKSFIAEHAANFAIRNMGFLPMPGGTHAWGGSWEVTDAGDLLAARLGTQRHSHYHSGYKQLESVINGVNATIARQIDPFYEADYCANAARGLATALLASDIDDHAKSAAARFLDRRVGFRVSLDAVRAGDEEKLLRQLNDEFTARRAQTLAEPTRASAPRQDANAVPVLAR